MLFVRVFHSKGYLGLSAVDILKRLKDLHTSPLMPSGMPFLVIICESQLVDIHLKLSGAVFQLSRY